ncbi:MAG: hybrid sensor histidine kinase/response regulator [Candidatus Competibacteraceae bacterium]|jgi:signal transduction histidine kinase|nr:hybrid sensor histidine kinase/response regulator [Candidatus Competibacteraceae bacterium]
MSVREKILIVDDNPTNIEILQEYLEDNYDLEIASSGEEALEKAASFQPAIILLDIMMPGMDGYEVCKRVRATPSLAHIKIIILSVKAMLSERLEGYTSGADDYITKPFEEEELLAKVRVYLRLKSVEEMNELNSNLLAMLSHETRTPLTSILMPVEILLADQAMDADKRKTLLDIVYDGTKNLQKLFDKIFLLNTLKTGTATLDFVQADLCELTSAAIEALSKAAEARNLRIEPQLPDNLVVRLDRKKIQQVIESILDNAVRFSPACSAVQINVFEDNQYAMVTIADHGEGIDPQFLAQVFNEFACSDVDHHGGGHGLSLAIAKQIVSYHDGTIDAESTPEIGTTITLRLPLAGPTDR